MITQGGRLLDKDGGPSPHCEAGLGDIGERLPEVDSAEAESSAAGNIKSGRGVGKGGYRQENSIIRGSEAKKTWNICKTLNISMNIDQYVVGELFNVIVG